jgi:hypothetical protein
VPAQQLYSTKPFPRSGWDQGNNPFPSPSAPQIMSRDIYLLSNFGAGLPVRGVGAADVFVAGVLAPEGPYADGGGISPCAPPSTNEVMYALCISTTHKQTLSQVSFTRTARNDARTLSKA